VASIPAFDFSTAHILFGTGRSDEIGALAPRFGSRAALVIGERSLRDSGRLDRITARLSGAGVVCEIFEGVEAEAPLATLQRCTDWLRERSCDVVIAVGGGSVIDVGKTAACFCRLDGSARDYFDGAPVPGGGLPVIAAPTTAGTGSEVTSVGVFVDTERGIKPALADKSAAAGKSAIRSEYLLPTIALVDPELTVGSPPEVTAPSGMDAFTQAVEGYTSRWASPITDALALDAALRIGKHLPAACERPDNLGPREQVALGSLLAGIALDNARLGLVHALAHPVGVATGLPHGVVCAALLPHVIEFNLDAAREKYRAIAAGLRVPSVDVLSAFVRSLNRRLGIDARIAGVTIAADALPAIGAESMKSGSMPTNPRDVTPEQAVDVAAAAFPAA
jgi:alcohol dehydrogenase class IV